jgi:hypothetical protein
VPSEELISFERVAFTQLRLSSSEEQGVLEMNALVMSLLLDNPGLWS